VGNSTIPGILAPPGSHLPLMIPYQWSFGLPFCSLQKFSPSRIAATAVGGAGAYLYPVETWNRIPLTYPVGISDINRISGSTYSLAAFKQIPHFIFVGEKDLRYENDPVNFDDNYDRRQAYIINTYFGKNPVERSVKFADYLKSIGMQATLKIYPGVGHDYTHEMIRDTFNFFDSVPIE
jgi:hypothetical protein